MCPSWPLRLGACACKDKEWVGEKGSGEEVGKTCAPQNILSDVIANKIIRSAEWVPLSLPAEHFKEHRIEVIEGLGAVTCEARAVRGCVSVGCYSCSFRNRFLTEDVGLGTSGPLHISSSNGRFRARKVQVGYQDRIHGSTGIIRFS
jgi:hypothetical protein